MRPSAICSSRGRTGPSCERRGHPSIFEPRPGARRALERIVDALRAADELDSTLLVFTSDNGFFHGEHRVPGGKTKVYEPSVHVPALMRGPGVPPNTRIAQLTANVDLAATIVDATGADPRRTLDGVSLLALARQPSRFGRRDILLANGPNSGPSSPRYAAIRTRHYKYVEYATGERELYDMRRDRFEQRSVHDSRRYQGVRRSLARKLARLRDCSGESCRR